MKHPMNILLVEDNRLDEELTLTGLSRDGLDKCVTVVRDGEQALDYIFCRGSHSGRCPRNPDLILLDINLPKIGGIEVLREIRENAGTRIIPVVALTSSNQDQDILESYKLGINSYIVKPVDADKFMETIKQLNLYWNILNVPPPEMTNQ